jgi:hypothetical protein
MPQSHQKFKLFIGTQDTDGSLGALGTQVEAFVTEKKVAAKSIGAEFIEHSGKVLLSLGYRDDQPSVAVRLTTDALGSIGKDPNAAEVEAKMERAAAARGKVICHELFINAKDELFMVFMSEKA